MPDAGSGPDITDDHFLGGRLVLRQPVRGHRAGHDAMLLAAVTPARAGDVVVDLGAGVGAAGLAVARRQPGIDLVLAEIDPALAALARYNAETNGIAARIVVGDVGSAEAFRSGGFGDGCADSVMMNPPFHTSERHRASPDSARRLAHAADAATLPLWVESAHRLVKSRGILTLIWRADDLPRAFDALHERFGSLTLWPVHGSRNKPAVRVLLRAVRGGRAPLVINPPVVLDGSDEKLEAALRGKGPYD